MLTFHDPVQDGLTIQPMMLTPYERWFIQILRAGDGKAYSDALCQCTEVLRGLVPSLPQLAEAVELADHLSFTLDDVTDDTYPLREHYRSQLTRPDTLAIWQHEAPNLTCREARGADGIPAMGR
jgi:hypothetical protein